MCECVCVCVREFVCVCVGWDSNGGCTCLCVCVWGGGGGVETLGEMVNNDEISTRKEGNHSICTEMLLLFMVLFNVMQ